MIETLVLSLGLIGLASAARTSAVSLPLLWTGRAGRRGFGSMLVPIWLGHVAAWLAWALSAWWALQLIGRPIQLVEVVRIFAVASTPMLVAWIGLFPFVGPILNRGLALVSLSQVVLGLSSRTGTGLVPAVAVAIPGGVVLLLVLALLSRPAYSARQPRTAVQDQTVAEGPSPAGPAEDPAGDGTGDAGHYLVYLQGISAYSSTFLPHREMLMLKLLRERVPRLVVVSDVFPYDMDGVPLGPGRAFWRWVHRERLRRGAVSILGRLINVRNLLLLAVSADRRYAAVYSRGLAAVLQRALVQHRYPLGSRQRVTLLGYSGGAQLAAGTAAYLARGLDAPVRLICVGGVIWNDRGFSQLEHLFDLVGSRDLIRRLATLLCPARWRIAVGSEWNRARSAGRVTRVVVGPMDHTGRGGYFDRDSRLPDGRTFMEATTADIVMALE